MTNVSRVWLAVIIFLVVAIIAGGVITFSRYDPGQPVEISLLPSQEWTGTVHIDGAVNRPGSYPFRGEDTIDSLVKAAGGTSANLSSLQLYIGETGSEPEISASPAPSTTGTQKIDINRADAKMLEALPGIGEVLAQRIIDYRRTKGPFRSAADIVNVNGIGPAIYERVKDLITVGE